MFPFRIPPSKSLVPRENLNILTPSTSSSARCLFLSERSLNQTASLVSPLCCCTHFLSLMLTVFYHTSQLTLLSTHPNLFGSSIAQCCGLLSTWNPTPSLSPFPLTIPLDSLSFTKAVCGLAAANLYSTPSQDILLWIFLNLLSL